MAVPERTAWDVVRSPDGDFAFSMPTRPARESREARGAAGTLEIASYSCAFDGSEYALRRVRSPAHVPPDRVVAELGHLRPRYLKENARLVKETPIVVDGVIGEDLTYTTSPPRGTGVVTARTRHFINGQDYYALTVSSPPGRPLPDAAARFLSSLTFDALVRAHYARMRAGTKATARPGPRASRPPSRARVKMADATPEDALRTFVLAVAAQDEPTLRAVTLPDDRIARLLRRRPASQEALDQLKSRLDRIAMRRLKAGDTARMADGTSRILRTEDVPERRVVLWPANSPHATTIEDVGGHWKVLARPLIDALGATEARDAQGRPPSPRSRPTPGH